MFVQPLFELGIGQLHGGVPAFVLWWLLASRPTSSTRAFGLVGLSVILYWCHALWFAFACLALVGLVLVERPGIKASTLKLAAMLPVGIASLTWVQGLGETRAEYGFYIAPAWVAPVWLRPLPLLWGKASVYMGGTVWLVLLVFVIAWPLAAFMAAKRCGGKTVDKALLATAAVAIGLYSVVPDVYLNTHFFSWRWAAIGLVFLLIALPAPQMSPRMIRGASVGAFLLAIGWTGLTWAEVNKDELTGLEAALAAVPEGSKVVGLDFVRESAFVEGLPFLHMEAWATVLHGAETDFSFAEHAHGLVRYRERREVPWRRGRDLELTIIPDDHLHFDFALVNLPEERHSEYVDSAPLVAVTQTGRWRLYRVLPD